MTFLRRHGCEAEVQLLPFTTGTRRRCIISIMLQLLPPQKDPIPNAQEAGCASTPAWMTDNLAPPLGFDPWAMQPIASHYTEYTISAPFKI
jgi:hypothetical protein